MAFDPQSAIERRDRLRQEGKIELPLSVDTRKYLLSFIKYRDILISLPLFLICLGVILYMYYSGYEINPQIVIIALSPWGAFLTILSIPHPDRKNINFLTHKIIWRFQFKRRQRLFIYEKGGRMAKNKNVQDIREQLGIRNVYSECYETTDNHFVKVIKVSSVNLSLLNKKDKEKIFRAYETFLNDVPRSMLPLQISQIAQPINLSKYSMDVETEMAGEENIVKKMFAKSYLKHVDDIQKSKDMVTRNRYVILGRPFNMLNRKKVLDQLERDCQLLASQIANMVGGRHRLEAKGLDNEELFQLMFACIDYENAQVNFNFRPSQFSPLTVGSRTQEEMERRWAKMKEDHIM
ncbi:MAG: hypothetical protein ACQEXV_25240 [Bacillota bacterium]